jgi:hypothetical protein
MTRWPILGTGSGVPKRVGESTAGRGKAFRAHLCNQMPVARLSFYNFRHTFSS